MIYRSNQGQTGGPQSAHGAMVLAESSKHKLVNKWQKVLKKFPEIPRNKIGNFATLLENQFNHSNPGSGSRSSLLTEDMTTTGNIADFTRFALPLLRKSYPRLIADNLVGVQPLTQPASLVFYLRYRYALTKGQTQAGTQIMRQNTSAGFNRTNGWALDPYYSSQEVRGEVATFNGPVTVATGTETTVSATLQHNPVLSGTVVVEVFASADDASPACDNPTPALSISFATDGSPELVVKGTQAGFANVNVDVTTPGATAFNPTTGAIQVTVETGSGDVDFPAGAVARVNYEYDLEGNPFQPELTLSIESDSVTARPRKLKTSWSLEAAQDLMSVHGIDAESTMTDLMADEMVAEIDREIINHLILGSSIRSTHNFGAAAGTTVNFTDRNIALLYKTIEVANIIHRTTLRGPANWVVTSSDIASKFEQLNDFRASDALTQDGVDIGITNAGTIQGKMRLYKDPLFPNCKLLLGYKGSSVVDTGYIYCPYIPLVATPTVLDPNSYNPTRGVMSRYGTKLLEDGGFFYGTMTVTNL